MADYTLTAALVKASASAKIKQVLAGGAVTPGTPIYIDAQRRMVAADANGAAVTQAVRGIALTGSAEGQQGLYAESDPEFDLGVTVGSGETVILSANVGKLAPNADAVSGWRKVVVGVGIGGTKINLKPVLGGIV